ncbi:hypothetical protein AALP_AA1G198600 [Arabis alpina]|uniref:Uncharacterized protein n=1 Tax=Arabis alpina TaxID=50452 RepID=A0A087HPC4_ARAAL|nr:hypothetical protein AALP_AA1G198600 [Arabis alpina]
MMALQVGSYSHKEDRKPCIRWSLFWFCSQGEDHPSIPCGRA